MKTHFLPVIKVSYFTVIILSFFLAQKLIAQSPLHNFYNFSSKPDSLINNIVQVKPNYILLSWHNKPIHLLSTQIYGRKNSLSFIVEPTIVNEPYGPDILGIDYTRSGISGRITKAFVRYENDLLSFQLGRTPVHWGTIISSTSPFQFTSNRTPIIPHHSTNPNYDHLIMKFKFGQFRLEVISGQLGSEEINGNRIKRNIAGHRLTWISKNEKLFASFGEQIIYTGINRGLEWHYMNPFIPYFFSSLEGDEESTDTGDNDNSILFTSFRYDHKPNMSIFGELIIDDFQVDDENLQDGLGYKIGADGAIGLLGKSLTWTMEWTSINSWTYIHHGQFTSWQNRGHSLGYPYGPDLRSFLIQANTQLSESISLNITANWLEKGINTLTTEWENSDNKNNPFPTPPVTHHRLISSSLSWFWKYGILEAGWSNYDFPKKIAFSDPQVKSEGSLFLNVQFFYTLDFNL